LSTVFTSLLSFWISVAGPGNSRWFQPGKQAVKESLSLAAPGGFSGKKPLTEQRVASYMSMAAGTVGKFFRHQRAYSVIYR